MDKFNDLEKMFLPSGKCVLAHWSDYFKFDENGVRATWKSLMARGKHPTQLGETQND